ncbi:MAG: metallophosphoesterase [Planctomycetota bacterium]
MEDAGVEHYGKVIRFPARGRMIVTTDLHGNLGDFERLVAAFREALEEESGEAFFLSSGDLVHGPCYSRARWPEHLGDYYPDQSVELLEAFVALREEFPGRVFSLIGNHEHSHVGGPHVRKFYKKDPTETEFLEQSLGPERTEWAKDLFRSFPIAAVAGRGVVVTHGAPRVIEASFAEICSVEYAGHEEKTIRDMISEPILGELFWCRSAGSLVVRRFLKRMQIGDQPNYVVVFGHDPVRRGYLREGDEQLCFSTSFGLRNAKKVYLDLDLTREYRSVRHLRYGVDLLPLYPELAKRKASLLGASQSQEG